MRETFHTQHLRLKEHSHENIVTNSAGHAKPMCCVLPPFGVFHCQRKAETTKTLASDMSVNQKPSHCYNLKNIWWRAEGENVKLHMAKHTKVLTLYLVFQIKFFRLQCVSLPIFLTFVIVKHLFLQETNNKKHY